MIYSAGYQIHLPSVDILTLLFDSEHCLAKENTTIHAEARDPLHGITKAQARSLTTQFAYFLRHCYGIGMPGPSEDIVFSLCSGQSALACLFFGVIAAGGIYSAVSPLDLPADLARQIRDGPGKVFICSDGQQDLALSVARESKIPDKNVLVLVSHPEISLQSIDGTVQCDFSHSLRWTRITDPTELENSKICILYSSGTTGRRKGVVLSHANFVAQSMLTATIHHPIYNEWSKESAGYIPKTIGHLSPAHLSCVLLYFVMEFMAGGTVYWMPSFNFDDFMRYAAEQRIPALMTIPPIFGLILQQPQAGYRLKHVRYAVSGAAHMNPDIQRAVSNKLSGIPITQVWGMTETSGAATCSRPGSRYPAGCAGPLMPNIQLRLVDENDNDVPLGQPGEALVKGHTVMKGYHNNPEANKIAYDSNGWLRTGDIVRIEDDLLYMIERKKELIKYQTIQIAPAELEAVLSAHPAVSDAAVIGIPHAETEVPHAYIVLSPQFKGTVTAAHVIHYVETNVADHKQLRGGVTFVDAIPRNPSGKVLRKTLRDKWQANVNHEIRLHK